LLGGIDPALLVLAEPIGGARLDAGQKGDASLGATGRGGQFQSSRLLVDLGAFEVPQRHSFGLGGRVGLSAELFGQRFGVIRKIDETDVPSIAVAADAAVVVEQPRLAAKPETIESERTKRTKAPKRDRKDFMACPRGRRVVRPPLFSEARLLFAIGLWAKPTLRVGRGKCRPESPGRFFVRSFRTPVGSATYRVRAWSFRGYPSHR
jgi:hypothetical protein